MIPDKKLPDNDQAVPSKPADDNLNKGITEEGNDIPFVPIDDRTSLDESVNPEGGAYSGDLAGGGA